MSFSPFASSDDIIQVPRSIQKTVEELKLKELRVELKNRGLSPSGLKRDLMRRLEEALTGEIQPQDLKDSEPKVINKRKRQVEGAETHSRLHPKKRRKQRSEDDEDEDEGEEDEGIDSDISDDDIDYEDEDEVLSDCEDDDGNERPTSDSDSEDIEENKEDSYDALPSILSGRNFAKEVTHPTQTKGEVKSLERFTFFGDSFTFTHRFWTESQLIRDFTISGGTFKTLPHLSVADVDELPTSVGAQNGKAKEKVKERLDGKKGVKSDLEMERGNRCRVILHWPPVRHSPGLRHHCNITYSHLFLVKEEPFSRPPRCKLISKHRAVFIEDEG